jgi:hypothetical protein
VAEAPVQPPPARPRTATVKRWARGELTPFLEILALCGLGVAQPLLDVTGRSPDFFLFYGAGRGDILLMVAIVILVPPVALWGIGAPSGLAGAKVRRAVHVGTIGVLLGVLAVQVGKHVLPVRGLALAVGALAVAGAATFAYVRWRVPGQLLRVASLGPLVFAALFAFASPVSAVVLPRAAAAGAAGVASSGGHPPLVVLFLDEFPLVSVLDGSGRIDRATYPNIAQLADSSTWYRNATGVSGWTPYAMPAMLTGRYPRADVAPHYSAYPDNLFTVFGGLYDLDVQESITQLCPPSECDRAKRQRGGLITVLSRTAGLLRQIASPRDEAVSDPEASYEETTHAEAASQAAPGDPRFRWDSLDDNQPARFTKFLANLTPTPQPTVHFLHLLMPHTPWVYFPDGMRYPAPEDFPQDGPGWVEAAHVRHLAQVGYADHLVGEMITRLKQTGLWNTATVVVTADHGVSFTNGSQGRGLRAVKAAPEEVMWVPLFVKQPGQTAGRVDDRNWQHVDLLPTVADLSGVTIPWSVDGVDAMRGSRDGTEKTWVDVPPTRTPVDGAAAFRRLAAGQGVPDLPAQLRPDLLGKPVSGLAVDPSDGPAAQVLDLAEYGHVDLGTGTVPALVYGKLPDAIPNGTPIAVAVNGTIGAVVQATWPDKLGRRFEAFVRDHALFRSGPNRLDLYEVSGGRLRRLPVSR